MFLIVQAVKVTFALEKHFAGCGGAMMTSPGFEQGPGSLIAGRDGGVDVAHITASRAFEQGVEHAAGQLFTAGFLSHGDLPDEQGIGLTGDDVGGNEAYEMFLTLRIKTNCRDGGVAEMRAMQKIAVKRVRVQRRAFCDESVQSRSVVSDGRPKENGRFLDALHHVDSGGCDWRCRPLC